MDVDLPARGRAGIRRSALRQQLGGSGVRAAGLAFRLITGIAPFRPPHRFSPNMTRNDFALPGREEASALGAIAPRRVPRTFAAHRDARLGIAATVAAWATGIALTALVLDYPEKLLTVRSDEGRVAIATASACVAILAAYLIISGTAGRRVTRTCS